jgi:hypothetical protein
MSAASFPLDLIGVLLVEKWSKAQKGIVNLPSVGALISYIVEQTIS